jgi:restriction system protein
VLSFVLFSIVQERLQVSRGTVAAFEAISILKWVALAACLVAAGLSFRQGRRTLRPFEVSSREKAARLLRRMGWLRLEPLIVEAFERRGYTVKRAHAEGVGEVDLALHKHGLVEVVQCKHWDARRVDVRAIEELHARMASSSADAGWLMTLGRFTRDAYRCALGKQITLMDGPAMAGFLREARSGPTGAPSSGDRPR